ncbi:MAG: hypothetical protein KAT74_06260, partial [Candidatus Cloacimonetes bacterium]|nr:hypothetical protein [Candidatus Cloacimonadota bacterium]
GWSNGAAMNISNVNSLLNDYMLPFIISVACNTGQFSGNCFAEAWLRATNAGTPTGAIAMYASTIGQSWSPPMRAQDEAVDLLVGDFKKTIGGLWYNGSCNMMDVYGTSGQNEFRHWTIFGDASLAVRTDIPASMVVSHNPNILVGQTTFDVLTDTQNALVCLYDGTNIVGSGYADIDGDITLTLDPVPSTPMDLTLTVTAYNKITSVETVPVIASAGPYVTIYSYTANAGGDDVIEAGETVNLTVTLKNIGTATATNVNMTLTESDIQITLTDSVESYGSIAAGGYITRTNAYTFDVSLTVPDNHPIHFDAEINADEDTLYSEINLTASNPAYITVDPTFIEKEMRIDEIDTDSLTITNVSVSTILYTIRTEDTTGRDLTGSYIVCSTDNFTPGETVDWTFTVYNLSPDNEWVTDVNIHFPYDVTVNSASNFVGGSGGPLVYDGTTGENVLINWHGATGLGYGVLHAGQTAMAVVNVTTTTEFAGNIVLNYEIVGDGYGSEPHSVTGT